MRAQPECEVPAVASAAIWYAQPVAEELEGVVPVGDVGLVEGVLDAALQVEERRRAYTPLDQERALRRWVRESAPEARAAAGERRPRDLEHGAGRRAVDVLLDADADACLEARVERGHLAGGNRTYHHPCAIHVS